jgi:hypothetical protein
MAEKMVRCIRCHEVFDASEGPCTKCGTPYQEPIAAPAIPEGLFSEKYGTVAAEPVPQVMVAPGGRDRTTYMIYGGIALIGAVVVVALLFSLGLNGGVGDTPPPLRAVVPAGSVEQPLPQTVDTTLTQLNDPNFSAHVTVQSRIQVTATVSSKALVAVVKYDGIVSGGNQWGTLHVGATAQEAMLVDGGAAVRTLPAAKWTPATTFASYKILCPMFGLKDANTLEMVGQETQSGQPLNHMHATHWWAPDLSRLTLYDMSFLAPGLAPDVTSFDLWAKPDGTPVRATYSAKTMAGQVALVDIEVSYTFTNVGQAVAILIPGATYTESPGPAGASVAP